MTAALYVVHVCVGGLMVAQAGVIVNGAAGETVTVNWLAPGATVPTTYTCEISETTQAYLSVPSGSCNPIA
jgi:hypothetical protein